MTIEDESSLDRYIVSEDDLIEEPDDEEIAVPKNVNLTGVDDAYFKTE